MRGTRTCGGAAAAIVAIVVALQLFPAGSASAYALLSCRFGGTGLYWRPFNLTSRVSSAASTGTGAWNATSTPIDFVYSGTSTDPHVAIWDADYGMGYWGLTFPPDNDTVCADTGGIWSSSEVAIQIDTAETATLSQYALNIVLEHELGHAQGLAHSSSSCVASNTNKKVMSTGSDKFSCTGTAPWADDVAGVNAIY